MRSILIISLMIQGISASPVWADPQPFAPDAQTFLARVDAQAKLHPTSVAHLALRQGQTAYLPLESLIRGQDEISVDNVLAKLQERIAAKEVHWDETRDSWGFSFDQGRSPVPQNDPIQIVLGPQGPVIVDGHHDVYLALYLGAKTIPARVVEDLSHLSSEEFWKSVKSRELVLLAEDATALARSAPGLRGIHDNPNRYLASLLALKASTRVAEDGSVEIVKVKGSANGAWIKVDDSVPFIEFYLAKALADAGIHYDPKWGKNVPPEVTEQARQALLQAQAEGRTPGLERIPLMGSSAEAARAAQDKGYLSKLIKRSVGYSSVACGSVFGE